MNRITNDASVIETEKHNAAVKALDYVRPGMRLGLGSGSTANHFIDLLGVRVKEGLDIVGVPTSDETCRRAERAAIPLSTLDEIQKLDLVVDGADEIGPGLALIKGGGGAHLREKIVASAAERMVVIADSSKHVPVLGKFPLPLEIARFGACAVVMQLQERLRVIGIEGDILCRRTKDGTPVLSDNGHYIFDGHFGFIENPARLARMLNDVPGLIEHGLFMDMAHLAIISGPDGIRLLERDT